MKLKHFVYLIAMIALNNCIAEGKIINASDFNAGAIQSPEIVTGNKSPTLNGMGYILYDISPLGKEFVVQEAKPNKNVIEIGAGFNNIPIEALRQNVLSYTANDMSREHLAILIARVKEAFGDKAAEKIKSLQILLAKAPDELPKVHEKYDAIIADRVIHFMPPEAILRFIKWSKDALKTGGKMYIATASPYSKPYTKLFPEYLKRLEQHDLFPGHFTTIMQDINPDVMKENYPKYKLPNEMVLFSRKDLIALFEREGMRVLKSYSMRIPTEKETSWGIVPDEESNVVGVVVVKEHN
jgi:SAM-dependent methyltransferase